MRKFYFPLILIFSITAVLIIIYSFGLFQKLKPADNTQLVGVHGNTSKPDYHFVVVCQNIDEPFWQSVKQGATQASKEFNVAIEFNGPRFTNLEEELQDMDIAIASKVDGIVTDVLDENRFTPLIDKAVGKNIPVVTIDTDAKNSKRASFIGTNSYKLGNEWGKLIIEATGGKAVVAIPMSSYSSDGENTTQNLIISGLRDAIKEFPSIKIKTIQVNKNGIFSAEEITTEILNQYTDVNAILCTNAKYTLGAAQVLVDFNKVGDIAIIGCEDTPDILRYVEKGVVYGTVAGNPEKMGYESIKALVEIKKKNRTSSYIPTDVHVITSKNVSEYKDRIGND